MSDVVERCIVAFVSVIGACSFVGTLAYVLNVIDQIQKRK